MSKLRLTTFPVANHVFHAASSNLGEIILLHIGNTLNIS
jgi:hypothetical protein